MIKENPDDKLFFRISDILNKEQNTDDIDSNKTDQKKQGDNS